MREQPPSPHTNSGTRTRQDEPRPVASVTHRPSATTRPPRSYSLSPDTADTKRTRLLWLQMEAREKAPFCRSLLSGRRDSNPRPTAWEADALPTELRPRVAQISRSSETQPRRQRRWYTKLVHRERLRCSNPRLPISWTPTLKLRLHSSPARRYGRGRPQRRLHGTAPLSDPSQRI
jgi:hypothetical protein